MTVFAPMVDKHTRPGSPLVAAAPGSPSLARVPVRPLPLLLGAVRDEGQQAALALYRAHQAQFASQESIKRELLPSLLSKLLGPSLGTRDLLRDAVYRSGSLPVMLQI